MLRCSCCGAAFTPESRVVRSVDLGPAGSLVTVLCPNGHPALFDDSELEFILDHACGEAA